MAHITQKFLLLRVTLAVVLLMHSIPSLVTGGVYEFGQLYLNKQGFSPIGVPLAWAIKLSHVAAAICLIINRFIKWAGWITISILVAGIAMIHYKEGWFVVGNGRNGMEFNLLLIAAWLTIMFQQQQPQVP